MFRTFHLSLGQVANNSFRNNITRYQPNNPIKSGWLYTGVIIEYKQRIAETKNKCSIILIKHHKCGLNECIERSILIDIRMSVRQ